MEASQKKNPWLREESSILEVYHMETGQREALARFDGVIEAPNWSKDGSFLIYNSGGRLYRFDLGSRTSSGIPTGFAAACNNDHVLSPDGTGIAISHMTREDLQSRVYTLRRTPAGHAPGPQLPARLVPGRKDPGLLRPTGWRIRRLHGSGRGRRGGPADQRSRPERWTGIQSRWGIYLVQLRAHRADAGLAHEGGRLGANPDDLRPGPEHLVPPYLAGWETGGDAGLPERGSGARRASSRQAGGAAANGGFRRFRPHHRGALWRSGDHQCKLLVARQQTLCLCQLPAKIKSRKTGVSKRVFC